MNEVIVEASAWYGATDLRWAARHWADRIGVRLRQVHIRPMSTKWASIVEYPDFRHILRLKPPISPKR